MLATLENEFGIFDPNSLILMCFDGFYEVDRHDLVYLRMNLTMPLIDQQLVNIQRNLHTHTRAHMYTRMRAHTHTPSAIRLNQN